MTDVPNMLKRRMVLQAAACFAVGGLLGLFLPWLLHVLGGLLVSPFWGNIRTEDTWQLARLVFVVAGGISVLVPALVSFLFLRGLNPQTFARGIFYAGMASAALLVMACLYPYTFLGR